MGFNDYLSDFSGGSDNPAADELSTFAATRSPGLNLGMLIQAIANDPQLSSVERMTRQLELKRATNYASDMTPVDQLMYGAAGAVIGALLARYFGFKAPGMALGGLAGYGLGQWIGNAMAMPSHNHTRFI